MTPVSASPRLHRVRTRYSSALGGARGYYAAMAGSEQDSYPELFAQVLAEWNGIEQTEADTVCRWVEAFALMSDEMDSLKLRNQWAKWRVHLDARSWPAT